MVSEIGFGGWGIGGRTEGATSYGVTDDAQSRRALEVAFERGITLFDTAPAYGDGHSETLIGQVFAGRRDRVVIATKAGCTRFTDPLDFTPVALRRSLEGSLRRLGTDRVDLLQLHSPPPGALDRLDEIANTLERFRRDGLIGHYGVSVKAPRQVHKVLDACHPAAVQVNLNMLDWRAMDEGVLDRAAGVGVVARTPLCFGFLSGAVTDKSVFPPGDHRACWPPGQLARWTAGAAAVMAGAEPPHGQTRAQGALRFCLSFPAVATVIPGIMTVAEAVENAAASDQGRWTRRCWRGSPPRTTICVLHYSQS